MRFRYYATTKGNFMRKTFKLQDLDCANCAAKMEAGIKNLDGVRDATVSFLSQKLVLDADETRFGEILDETVRVCKKIEPDMVILR